MASVAVEVAAKRMLAGANHVAHGNVGIVGKFEVNATVAFAVVHKCGNQVELGGG